MSVDAVPCRIRALVVDDEPLARANVLHLLRANPEVEILGECESAAAALEAIRAHKPDLVFLDVRMPEYDGFDMLEMLGAEASASCDFCHCVRSVRAEGLRCRRARLPAEAFQQRAVCAGF